MTRQEFERLLGGYATRSLTPEQEETLMAAALEEQELFDLLAREQPLRELLDDPAARASLLGSLAEAPAPWYRSLGAWFTRPRALALAAGALCVMVPVAVWQAQVRNRQPVLVARMVDAVTPQALPQPSPAPPATKAEASTESRRRGVVKQAPAAKAKKEAAPPPPAAAPASPPAEAASAAPPAKTENAPVAAESQATLQAEAEKTARQASEELARAAKDVSAANGLIAGAQPANAPAPGSPRFQARKLGPARLTLLEPASRVTWTILRKQPGGELTPVNPADLPSGDVVTLRLESKDAGYVYVSEGEKLVGSSAVQAGKPFDTPIKPQGSGKRELDVWFSQREIYEPASAGRPAAWVQRPGSIHITLEYK